MKKKDKIYDSPEYEQIREHLPEILKEMERDKGLKQYQMPEGWNEDFERIYQAEHRKERIRNCILAGACAAIILGIGAVHVGERLELTSMVQADDIGKIHENEFEQGDYQFSTYGNSNEDEGIVVEDSDEITLPCTTIQELYSGIEEQIKNPYFRLDDIPDNYTIEEAVYSKLHRNINYRISWGNQYLYVSQQMEIDDTSNGTIDGEAVDEIAIKDLGQTVTIYCSAHDNSLNCSILYDKTVLFLVTNLEKEEFERIIGGIEYQ